ncbi:MAG: endonuclease III [Candidatus Epulonipiscioides saccharophilum]|nr:MAG: endonuclease III [Epulopiscium sp. AS2M-Bin001]
MTVKKHVDGILKILNEHYPKELVDHPKELPGFLNYNTPFELLIATILSAQCTDERVNIVTELLFKKYPSVQSFATADVTELEKDIKSIVFCKKKAQNIIDTAKTILREYDGQVPNELSKLIKLAGVGRKTANVVIGNIYKIPSIVVDTHVKRISKRWGFTRSDDPTKVEYDLMELLPEDNWISYNIQLIMHGRNICVAKKPRCLDCMFIGCCPYGLSKLYKELPEEVK